MQVRILRRRCSPSRSGAPPISASHAPGGVRDLDVLPQLRGQTSEGSADEGSLLCEGPRLASARSPNLIKIGLASCQVPPRNARRCPHREIWRIVTPCVPPRRRPQELAAPPGGSSRDRRACTGGECASASGTPASTESARPP